MQAMGFYDGLGGYAPTIGIIGAVLGLIHVMGNLADPSKLGGGIAAAFVATIYGWCLPTCSLCRWAIKSKASSKNRLVWANWLSKASLPLLTARILGTSNPVSRASS
jgi:chemotaxis protein MotA